MSLLYPLNPDPAQPEKRILLDTTAFSSYEHFSALNVFLKNRRVEDQIDGFKISDRHPYQIEETKGLFREERALPPVLVDDSASGGFNDIVDEMETVVKTSGLVDATFTFGRGVEEFSIRRVSELLNGKLDDGHGTTNFLVSTYLPENLPLQPSVLRQAMADEYTAKVHEQTLELEDVGVVGVYGAAVLGTISSPLALGSGVSFDGKRYESNGVWKESVDVETALNRCKKILIGHILLSGTRKGDSISKLADSINTNFNLVVDSI